MSVRKGLAVTVILLFISVSVIPSTGRILDKLSIESSNNTIIYVDDDNTEGPWYGTKEHPYLLIVQGVHFADEGDTVFVFSGFYGYFTIIVDKQIFLIGEDKNTTIIDGHNDFSLVSFYADGITMSGFKLCNKGWGWSGIVLHSNYNTVTDNIITDCKFGVHIYSNYNTIEDNIIEDRIDYGISFWSGSNYNNITDNIIRNNDKYGIEMFGTKHNQIRNNIIDSNNDGIYLSDNEDIFINNNIISNNSGDGIYLRSSIKNNVILHNTFCDNNKGVHITDSSGNTISKNNFINNTIHADFTYLDQPFRTKWIRNYWDNWFKLLPIPKFIKGRLLFYDPYGSAKYIPWINFDWFPARKPYDIPMGV